MVKRHTGDGIYHMEKETKPDGSVNVIENNTSGESLYQHFSILIK